MAANTPQWEVVDHNGEVVFDAEFISHEPCVVYGVYPAHAWAKRLAKEASDPEAPAPLQARRIR